MQTISLSNMKATIGKPLGKSDWIMVDQDRINKFADVTIDRQYIHIDPTAAANGPFGTTIAHGFLVLSLLIEFSQQAGRMIEGCETVVNYGMEKLRFLAPVPSGKRVRGHFTVAHVTEKRPGHFLIDYEISVEIEGKDKPALIAHWLCLQIRP